MIESKVLTKKKILIKKINIFVNAILKLVSQQN